MHEGNYKRAADELAILYRYQKSDDGMMRHEISQSAGFLNWVKDYPYMHVHVGITFDFLTELGEYDRISGDQAFLAQHWPATLKAYQYCLSRLDKSDGLPRVPVDKMSGNEQDRLTDELTLSASWVSAAHAMSKLAASMHDEALSRQAESASLRARDSIRSRYWDSTARRWISGLTRSGKATERTSAADLAAIASGASTPEQTAATLDMLMTSPYLTAWDCGASQLPLRIMIRPGTRKGVCGLSVRLGQRRSCGEPIGQRQLMLCGKVSCLGSPPIPLATCMK